MVSLWIISGWAHTVIHMHACTHTPRRMHSITPTEWSLSPCTSALQASLISRSDIQLPPRDPWLPVGPVLPQAVGHWTVLVPVEGSIPLHQCTAIWRCSRWPVLHHLHQDSFRDQAEVQPRGRGDAVLGRPAEWWSDWILLSHTARGGKLCHNRSAVEPAYPSAGGGWSGRAEGNKYFYYLWLSIQCPCLLSESFSLACLTQACTV